MTRHRRAHITALAVALAVLLVPVAAGAATATHQSEVPRLEAPLTGLFLAVQDGQQLLVGHRIEDLCAGEADGTVTLHQQEKDDGADYRQWYRESTDLYLYEDVGDLVLACDALADGGDAPEPAMSGQGRMSHDLTAIEDGDTVVLDARDTVQGTLHDTNGRVVPVSAGTTFHAEFGAGPPTEDVESWITLRR